MIVDVEPRYGSTFIAGQVFFTTNTKSVISNGIAWEINDEHLDRLLVKTHVGLCVGGNSGIEATPRGLKYVSLSKYFENKHSIITFRTPKALHEPGGYQRLIRLLHVADELVKSKSAFYDYPLLLAFALVELPWVEARLSKELRQKILSTLNMKDWYICSEAVAYLYWIAGFGAKLPLEVSPMDLWEAQWLMPPEYKRVTSKYNTQWLQNV